MIAIYPVSPADEELALENAKWWNELGGCASHEVLFIFDQRVKPDLVQQLKGELARCFNDIHVMQAGAMIDGWPEGANYMFRIAMGWLEQRPYKYFLWMEPDAVPLKEGWMDALQKEFIACHKPFMGGRVSGVYEGQEVPVHMTGIAIYPNPLYEHAGEAYRAFDVAWDIAAKDQIIPKAFFTNLFCHAWHHPGFKTPDELNSIPAAALIHHGVKDRSLIHLLQQRRRGGNTIGPKEPAIIAADSPAPLPAVVSACEAADPFYSHTKAQRFGDVPPPKFGALDCLTEEPAPAGVHQLPGDIWVIESDMISGVIKEKGRLDADELIPKILPYISEGDTVIDAGAFVGDHTVAYSKAAGEKGMVHCFEPNPLAFACLVHNTQACENVRYHKFALGNEIRPASLTIEPLHHGGAFINADGNSIAIIDLDSLGLSPNVIKLDLEGYEFRALMGAEKTINKHHPKLVIEINQEALKRQGYEPKNIFWFLNDHQYDWKILQENCNEFSPLYDIVALPRPKEAERNLSVSLSINDHIKALRTYADGGKEQRKYVLRLIREHGFTKPVKKTSAKVVQTT